MQPALRNLLTMLLLMCGGNKQEGKMAAAAKVPRALIRKQKSSLTHGGGGARADEQTSSKPAPFFTGVTVLTRISEFALQLHRAPTTKSSMQLFFPSPQSANMMLPWIWHVAWGRGRPTSSCSGELQVLKVGEAQYPYMENKPASAWGSSCQAAQWPYKVKCRMSSHMLLNWSGYLLTPQINWFVSCLE